MASSAGAGATGSPDHLGDEIAAMVAEAAGELLGCPASEVVVGSPRRLSGGASRLSYLVESAGADSTCQVVVQRERPGSAGTNLSMAAQAQMLVLAAQQGVPVPAVLASGGGDGSGFVVLEWLPGEAVAHRVMRDESLRSARGGLAQNAGRALAAIHRIDLAEAPELPAVDPVESMRGLLDMLGEPHPAFEIGLCWLEANRPAPRPAVLTHGDFRMGNLLVSPDGLTAVLDWELAHIGSPVEDLGWFCCRSWRFGSPMRAGGVGPVEDLLTGYAAGGGSPPDASELDWWEVYANLRWGLICGLQASVHLQGLHRSVELAAIGRRAGECEEDLLALIGGNCDYEPPVVGSRAGEPSGEPHDRPTAPQLLDAVAEALESLRRTLDGAAAFESRVSQRVVELVAREIRLAPGLSDRHDARMSVLGMGDLESLARHIRETGWSSLRPGVLDAVRCDVRDKLSVSNPGYWLGD